MECSRQTANSSLAKTTTTCSPKKKSRSFYVTKKYSTGELSALSEYNFQISQSVDRKLTIEDLVQYAEGLVANIYVQDPLKIKELILDFICNDLPKIKAKLQERLSLLNYLNQSLKYKHFAEIDHEIQKQWRRNIFFMSLNTIWSTKVQNHRFTSTEQFFAEYKKHHSIVSNLSFFYFQSALAILNDKNVPTFTFIQQETAHNIINAIPDWQDIYHLKVVPLLKKKALRDDAQVNMQFDLSTLNINQKYVNIRSQQVQLPQTIQAIRAFSQEHTITCKIARLRQIRQTFLRQLELSRQALEVKHNYREYSPLEKDDIIGCMIYCIVKGQLFNVQVSLRALEGLLGRDSELLSRKGVDSYRADLQSAIQYLCSTSQPTLIMVPESLKSMAI